MPSDRGKTPLALVAVVTLVIALGVAVVLIAR
jgi:hypothetical protein